MMLQVRAAVSGNLPDMQKVKETILEALTEEVFSAVHDNTPYDDETLSHDKRDYRLQYVLGHLRDTWKLQEDDNESNIYSTDRRFNYLIQGYPAKKHPRPMRFWWRRLGKWITIRSRRDQSPPFKPQLIGPHNADRQYGDVLRESVKAGADKGMKLAIRRLEEIWQS
jgi:hypothetical protein